MPNRSVERFDGRMQDETPVSKLTHAGDLATAWDHRS